MSSTLPLKWWFSIGIGAFGIIGIGVRLLESLRVGQLIFDWQKHDIVFHGVAAGAIYVAFLAASLLFLLTGLAARRRHLRGGG